MKPMYFCFMGVLVLSMWSNAEEAGVNGDVKSRDDLSENGDSLDAPKYNVLHIMIDDLRAEMGCYGLPDRHTPNMDKLASTATVFDRAFVQQAVCGPSRNSYLSGRRPDRSRSWNFINHFREDHPDWTSLPGVFLRPGKGTVSLGSGKIYHPAVPPFYDGAKSWSAQALPFKNPCWNTADWKHPPFNFSDGGLPCVFCPIDIEGHVFKNVSVTVANEWCSIDAWEDTETINHAISLLEQAAKEKKQFYLAVGMHKPHIPWQAQKQDYDKHPLDKVDLPQYPLPPKNVPPIALHYTDHTIHDSPMDPIKDKDAKAARRAYRAAVTGMDRKLGVLMDKLHSLKLSDTTAIVLHSDHGWHLGEHGEWRKMTCFEATTRVPFMIRAPWLQQGDQRVNRSSALVELVDLLPTIAELANIPLPTNESFDGVSLVPLLSHGEVDTVKDAAFSQYPRQVTDPSQPWKSTILHRQRNTFTHMGYSIRTEDWRYSEWVEWNQTTLCPIWSSVVGVELYDHRANPPYPTDFNGVENENVIGDPSNKLTAAGLSNRLRAHFMNNSYCPEANTLAATGNLPQLDFDTVTEQGTISTESLNLLLS